MEVTPEIIKRFRSLFPDEAPFMSDQDIKTVIQENEHAKAYTGAPLQDSSPTTITNFNPNLVSLFQSVHSFLAGKGINLRSREERRLAKKKFRCNYK